MVVALVILETLGDDAIPVALWAIGLVLFLAGLLMCISRLFRYRYSGRFEMPWTRGIAPMLVGLGGISAALWELGVREGLRAFWTYVLFVLIVIAVADVYRRTR